jgi:hypothetical protein
MRKPCESSTLPKEGMIIAAIRPMIAMVVSISIRVKPDRFWFAVFMLLKVCYGKYRNLFFQQVPK